ncbi:MAG: dihydropteroate synthase [Verrucomicrobia bacterium]|nr:dihydropteroate synthase [Verrucomicrobiota bacterium]
MIWHLRTRNLDLSRAAKVMGVLNVTPDSFSDGGKFFSFEAAVEHARELVADGAEIIDVGGESTRPGADPVPLDEELRRTIPVIERIHVECPAIIISIDTYKAEVARQAIAAGAEIINDVTGLRADPGMADVAQEAGAGVIVMHLQGTPKTMQVAPHYSDVVQEVFQFLEARRHWLSDRGFDARKIALDPGFGFGKRLCDNLALVRNLDVFQALARPVVVGISRKSSLAELTGERKLPAAERIWPTVAMTCLLRKKGAHVLRVHDVRANIEALRMTEAILERC